MSKVNHGWIKFYRCPKCENEKTTFVEYKDYIKLKCTKCKYVWKRGKKIMNKEENKIVRKCHWCKQDLYEKDIVKLENARGYGYYIICPNCDNRNVIQEIDLTREFEI